MRASIDKSARASGDKVNEMSDATRRREIAEEAAKIVESVKGEAAHQDETTPEGLAYHVNTFELEVERFLEVESWNVEHGFEVTDDVEEKQVEEMKACQAAGDQRRMKIKESFQEESSKLQEMENGIKELQERLERSAADAEKASKEEAESGSASQADLSNDSAKKKGAAERNPYTEYKAQLKGMGSGSTAQAAELHELDDAGVRTRVAALRAETELLRNCVKTGPKGDFQAFRHAIAGRTGAAQ
mmetsp:Transcript_54316/g.110853  ORF Transcript_54316/g.110853 Transcript_54316/m.110853 type:complete len:245 (+) Transcript_54316:116-850(+)